MDEYEKPIYWAAVRAQERMIEYLQGVRTGLVKADHGKAELLLLACDKTFDAWMATRRSFQCVAHSYRVH